MKLTRAEAGVLAVTLVFLALTAGYRIGRKQSAGAFTVRTATEPAVQTVIVPEPQSEESPPAEEKCELRSLPASEDEKLNINTAGKEALCDLDGIGETLSERIIAYREAHGPFACIEDITNVSGIGSGTFEKLRDRICVE